MYLLTATSEVAAWLTRQGAGDLPGLGADLGDGTVRLTQDELDDLLELDSDTDGTVSEAGPEAWTLFEDGSAWPIVLVPGAGPAASSHPRCRTCRARARDGVELWEVRLSAAPEGKPLRYCRGCLDRYGPQAASAYSVTRLGGVEVSGP